jgi:hypothetical protein
VCCGIPRERRRRRESQDLRVRQDHGPAGWRSRPERSLLQRPSADRQRSQDQPVSPRRRCLTPAAGFEQATVTWTAPKSDGGAPITGYRVATSPGPITGLTNGTSYAFKVAAKNAKGRGPWMTSTPATAGATVAPAAVVLSQASLGSLTQVDTDGSLVFTSPTAQVQGLTLAAVRARGGDHRRGAHCSVLQRHQAGSVNPS